MIEASGENHPRHLRLLDQESRAKLPKLHSGEEKGLEAEALVKFFTPDSNWTWYASEFDGGDIFFGLVSGYEVELGYFSLSELESVKGPLGLDIERDQDFKYHTLKELMEAHRKQRRGEIEILDINEIQGMIEKLGEFGNKLSQWDKRIVEIIGIDKIANGTLAHEDAIQLICTFSPEPIKEAQGFFSIANLFVRNDYEHVTEKLGITNPIDIGYKAGGKIFLPGGKIKELPASSIRSGHYTMKENEMDNSGFKANLLAVVFDIPWLGLIGNLIKIARKVIRGMAIEGVYEVIEYECTLELKDRDGKLASVKKRKKIRYLQDQITTYLDEAWGNGEILLNYQCSPGIPVDEYRLGHKTYKLLSLREFKNRADINEINVQWDIRNGFLLERGFWGTAINQRMKKLTVKIVFPKNRPPLCCAITESNLQRTNNLENDSQRCSTDGHPTIVWEKENPRLYEDYILSWKW